MDLNELNEDWQKSAPKLAAIEKANLFKVPEGYFEIMADQLNSQIKVLSLDDAKDIYSVPNDYFSTLSENINSRIKLEDQKETLVPFSVPDKYFENLQKNVQAKINSSTEQATKPFVKRIINNWITYAAAACITAVIGLSIYTANSSDSISKQMAALPSDAIADYLKLHSDAADGFMIISNLNTKTDVSAIETDLSDAEIEHYLESNL